MRLSTKQSDFLVIRKKFFNRLRNRGYPRRFLSDIFSEVLYSSRNRYLSRSKDQVKNVNNRVFFKTCKNPLFHGIHLKNLFLYHLGNDFDLTVCYKTTPNLARLIVH